VSLEGICLKGFWERGGFDSDRVGWRTVVSNCHVTERKLRQGIQSIMEGRI